MHGSGTSKGLRIAELVTSLLSLTRPPNGLMMFLAAEAGYFVSSRSLPGFQESLLIFATAYCLNGSSMVVNDVIDLEVDKMNAPWRPLPSGKVGIGAAVVLAVVLGVIGLIASLLVSEVAFLTASIFYIIALLYNFRLKAEGLVGNMAVSSTIAAPFLYGSVIALGSVAFSVAILGMLAFLAGLGREVIKGIPDVVGDRARNFKTIASMHGSEAAARIGASLLIVAVSLSPLPYLFGVLDLKYMAAVAVADVGFLCESLTIIRRHDESTSLKVKRRILLWMFVALLSFIVGAV